MDFTLATHYNLIKILEKQDFLFQTFEEFIINPSEKVVILRHDVDLVPQNALWMALIENEYGIKSSYYFRTLPQSFNAGIIKQIIKLGHEIGYHYEDLSLAAQRLRVEGGRQKAEELRDKVTKRLRGNNAERGTRNTEQLFETAIESFTRNLEKLRRYADVKTICMHGSPMSKWDSRLLWKYYDYKDFGIEAEPYFDVDFSEMLYLTDTGRRWNGSTVSVRDKGGSPPSSRLRRTEQGAGNAERRSDEVTKRLRDKETERLSDKNLEHETQNPEHETRNAEPFSDWVVKPVPGSLMNMTEKSLEFQRRYNFRTTKEIIKAAERGELPDRMMMTFHPQRWTDKTVSWVKELVWQNTKNIAKYFLIRLRD